MAQPCSLLYSYTVLRLRAKGERMKFIRSPFVFRFDAADEPQQLTSALPSAA